MYIIPYSYNYVHLSQFPGCCGGVVLHDPLQDPEGRWILDVALKLIQYKAVQAVWGSTVFATTIRGQKQFISWLRSKRFTKLSTFRNPRTGNTITLWQKKLSLRNVEFSPLD